MRFASINRRVHSPPGKPGVLCLRPHRFKDKKSAKTQLRQIERKYSLKFQLIFLDSFGTESWKQKALNAINQAEVVIAFNRKSCDESENANWEIKKVQKAKKKLSI